MSYIHCTYKGAVPKSRDFGRGEGSGREALRGTKERGSGQRHEGPKRHEKGEGYKSCRGTKGRGLKTPRTKSRVLGTAPKPPTPFSVCVVSVTSSPFPSSRPLHLFIAPGSAFANQGGSLCILSLQLGDGCGLHKSVR